MLRILQRLLPSCVPFREEKTSLLQNNSIEIAIENQVFVLGLSYQKDVLPLLKILQSQLPHSKITFLPSQSSPSPTKSFIFSFQKESVVLFCPLDFLSYCAKIWDLCSYYFKAQDFKDLQLELYRFRPYFLEPRIWYTLPEKDLKNLFHHMLTHHLATPKMFALFFKKITLARFEYYFSKRIGQDILVEYQKLEDEENPQILEAISYLIERNLILYLQSLPSPSEALEDYYHVLKNHRLSLYSEALFQCDLSSFDFFNQLSSSPKFPLLLKKIPYPSLLSFLAHSPEININLCEKGFSQQGRSQLYQDLSCRSHDPLLSDPFFDFLAQCSTQSSFETLEDHINSYFLRERDWEFLSREGDIRDLMIVLGQLPPKQQKKISGIVDLLYRLSQQKRLIFPKMNERSLITAQKNCAHTTHKLHFLKILSARP